MLLAALRLCRLSMCLAAGFAAALFLPLAGPEVRSWLIQGWCRALLWSLGVRLRTSGRLAGGPSLVVANHVSWLDVMAIGAVRPCAFVCKSEIAAWPGIAWLLRRAGTVFIRRGSLRDVLRVNTELRARLHAGETIAAFPEGTTTDGSIVLPFRPALFQPAADLGLPVQPVLLAYSSSAAAYVGDTSFGSSLRTIAGTRALQVEATLLPCLASSAGRKATSRVARAAILEACRASPLHARRSAASRAGKEGLHKPGAGVSARMAPEQ